MSEDKMSTNDNTKDDSVIDIFQSPHLVAAMLEYMRSKIDSCGFHSPSPPAQLSEAIRPAHSRIIFVRKALVFVSLIMAVICTLSLVCDRNTYMLFFGFLCVVAGASLILTVLIELHKGAGCHIERQFQRDKEYFRTYEFVSSITTLRLLFFLIAITYTSILVGYAAAYYAIATTHVGSFSSECSSLSAIYFALITFATVGYGDIVPITSIARIAVSSEIVISIYVNTILLAAIISWVTSSAVRRHEQEINARDREVQERESFIKNAKLGLYGNNDEAMKDIAEIIAKLEKKQPP